MLVSPRTIRISRQLGNARTTRHLSSRSLVRTLVESTSPTASHPMAGHRCPTASDASLRVWLFSCSAVRPRSRAPRPRAPCRSRPTRGPRPTASVSSPTSAGPRSTSTGASRWRGKRRWRTACCSWTWPDRGHELPWRGVPSGVAAVLQRGVPAAGCERDRGSGAVRPGVQQRGRRLAGVSRRGRRRGRRVAARPVIHVRLELDGPIARLFLNSATTPTLVVPRVVASGGTALGAWAGAWAGARTSPTSATPPRQHPVPRRPSHVAAAAARNDP